MKTHMPKPIVIFSTFRTRLKGLLFTEPQDAWFLFTPCKSIHTFGMRTAIDVAFLRADGTVVEVAQKLGSKKTLRNSQASLVIERFESDEAWLSCGDKLNLSASNFVQDNLSI